MNWLKYGVIQEQIKGLFFNKDTFNWLYQKTYDSHTANEKRNKKMKAGNKIKLRKTETVATSFISF